MLPAWIVSEVERERNKHRQPERPQLEWIDVPQEPKKPENQSSTVTVIQL